jgi:hypothetical protein
MVKGPSSPLPRNLSSGEKRANHLGGIIQVSESICGYFEELKFISSASSIDPVLGRNIGRTELGIEFLKSLKAAQHR